MAFCGVMAAPMAAKMPTKALTASSGRAASSPAAARLPSFNGMHRLPAITLTNARAAQRASRASVAVRAAAEGAADGGEIFPRIKERDPYRRLGISKEASYEEIQDARNYLVDTYNAHQKSVEAIEQAFDKIISQKLKVRKKTGIKLREDKKDEPAADGIMGKINALVDPAPDMEVAKKVVLLYVFLTAWSLAMSAATGPAFQLCIGFVSCVYFFVQKRQKNAKQNESKFWGCMGTSVLALFAGWFIGSLVPILLPVFPVWIAPETVATLCAFVVMCFAAIKIK